MEELGAFAFLFQFIDSWAYPITFFFTILENVVAVGMFIPGDVIVILASVTAAMGKAKVLGVALCSIFGTLIGNNITYAICYKYGRDLLLAIGRWSSRHRLTRRIIKIDEETIEAAELYFEKHGAKTVFLARFVAGLKSYIIAVAGASRMPLKWFEIYTLLAALAYSSIMCTLGWFLGDNIGLAVNVVSYIGYGGLAIFIILILCIWIASKKAREKKEEKPEELKDAVKETKTDFVDEFALKTATTLKTVLFTPLFNELIAFEAIGSTNEEAKIRAAAGAPEGTVLTAREQISGRGRAGHHWATPKDAVLPISVILRPQCNVEDLSSLSMVASIGVRRALVELGVPVQHVSLKWPNDVMIVEKKIAGILAESVSYTTDNANSNLACVLGIGLNLDRELFYRNESSEKLKLVSKDTSNTGFKPAFLSDELKTMPPRDIILSTLIDCVLRAYNEWASQIVNNPTPHYDSSLLALKENFIVPEFLKEGPFAPMHDEFLEAFSMLGKPVVIRAIDKSIVGRGIVGDITGTGLLIVWEPVRGGADIRLVSAGEVSLCTDGSLNTFLAKFNAAAAAE